MSAGDVAVGAGTGAAVGSAVPGVGTVAGAAIGAGAALLSDVLGIFSSNAANKRNFNNTVKLWNMQNEYNKPINQMARLKEAGLNPNLMYNNAAAGGSASSMAAPQVQYNSPLSKALESISAVSQLQMQREQIKGQRIANENAQKQGKSLDLDNNLKKQEYDFNTTINPYRVGDIKSQIDKRALDSEAVKLSNMFNSRTFEYRVGLADNSLKESAANLRILSSKEQQELARVTLLKQDIKLRVAQTANEWEKMALNKEQQVLTQYQQDYMYRCQIPAGKAEALIKVIDADAYYRFDQKGGVDIDLMNKSNKLYQDTNVAEEKAKQERYKTHALPWTTGIDSASKLLGIGAKYKE